jgi:hypothetical protein
MQVASLILSTIGVIVTICIAVCIYKLSDKTTKEIKNILVALIVNSAPDPKTLERLFKDFEKTGEWRGVIEQDSTSGKYRIAWRIEPAIAKLGINTFRPSIKIEKGKNA